MYCTVMVLLPMLCLSVISSISSTLKVCRSVASIVRCLARMCPLYGISGSHSTLLFGYMAETVRVSCCSYVCRCASLCKVVKYKLCKLTYSTFGTPQSMMDVENCYVDGIILQPHSAMLRDSIDIFIEVV